MLVNGSKNQIVDFGSDSEKCFDADHVMFVSNRVLTYSSVSMGDFQQFEQDFYQTGYHIDDQGRTVADYDHSNSTCSAYSYE